jgi:SAM-dependent methyltransferase
LNDEKVSALLDRAVRLAELRDARARSCTSPAGPVGARFEGWGDFARLEPFSDVWGMDRGRCIDRFYIEGFLAQNAADIRGHVLEVNDPGYATEFGRGAVTRIDVIDIEPTNPRATIVADLRRVHSVPSETFDCIILTQTLHMIYEAEQVLAECVRLLRPSGLLLATLPCASRLSPEQGLDGDFWRFTPRSALTLFRKAFPDEALSVKAHGNQTVNLAFLYGLACHEIEPAAFDRLDDTPLIITVRAQKAPVSESRAAAHD